MTTTTDTNPIIARVRFADGAEWPVFDGLDGRQYVLDDDGEPTHGVWYIVKRCETCDEANRVLDEVREAAEKGRK